MPRLLITAGPTHEPIDRVRFIGNRSSGRLGIALADTAATGVDGNAWDVTLLLGPTGLTPSDSRVKLRRFQTAADLEALLHETVPACDALIMAAAVADYRPRPSTLIDHHGKIKRGDQTLTLELEPTTDLLADVATYRRADQTIVGFALEPRERLIDSATSKLARKQLDFIVANPLETMDAPTIEATLIGPQGIVKSWPPTSKSLFAADLLALVHAAVSRRVS